MDIALALDALVPMANYRGSLTKNTQDAYNSIVWLEEEIKKPSWNEVVQKDSELALVVAKEKKKDEIEVYAEDYCKKGTAWKGNTFPIGLNNVQELNAAKEEAKDCLAGNSVWSPIKWPTVTGVYVAILTPQQMIDLYTVLITFRRATHNVKASHIEAVMRLNNKTLVETYNFLSDWPKPLGE
jgi:hypothetical protein